MNGIVHAKMLTDERIITKIDFFCVIWHVKLEK